MYAKGFNSDHLVLDVHINFFLNVPNSVICDLLWQKMTNGVRLAASSGQSMGLLEGMQYPHQQNQGPLKNQSTPLGKPFCTHLLTQVCV